MCTGYQWISHPRSAVRAEPKTKDLVCYIKKNKNLFSYTFKLRHHIISGVGHISVVGQIRTVVVPPFKLLKYALTETHHELVLWRSLVGEAHLDSRGRSRRVVRRRVNASREGAGRKGNAG